MSRPERYLALEERVMVPEVRCLSLACCPPMSPACLSRTLSYSPSLSSTGTAWWHPSLVSHIPASPRAASPSRPAPKCPGERSPHPAGEGRSASILEAHHRLPRRRPTDGANDHLTPLPPPEHHNAHTTPHQTTHTMLPVHCNGVLMNRNIDSNFTYIVSYTYTAVNEIVLDHHLAHVANPSVLCNIIMSLVAFS